MDRSEWIGRLEILHALARGGGPLLGQDAAWYARARAELFGTAVRVQNAYLAGNENYRKAIRLERALPVSVDGDGWAFHAATADLGPGGFSVLTEASPGVNARGRATLEVPGAVLSEEVRIAAVVAVGSAQRVSVAFAQPSPATTATIEDLLLDVLLPKLVFWDQVMEKLPT